MSERYVAFAVPVFVVLIAIELLVIRLRGGGSYRFEDAVTNLSCGIGQQLLGLLSKVALFTLYLLAFEHVALFEFSAESPAVWVGALVVADLCYYAYHRAGHRVNAVWATHIVHHQSEEYNLSVALRQSWFTNLFSTVFYLPCAVLGVPPLIFVAVNTGITLYQFWIHTELIGTLGPIEWIFNTPSHHRVHHGINPRAIDKNYGGVFILWDRVFGTFEAEGEGELVYGTVTPLASWNPWWANVHYWVDTWRLAQRCQRLVDKLRIWVMPPEWRPADLGGDVTIPEVTRADQRKYAAAPGSRLRLYVAVQFLGVLGGSTLLLLVYADLPPAAFAAALALALVALATFGGLFEGRAWALPLEFARLAAAATCGAVAAAGGQPLYALLTVAAVACGIWLWSAGPPVAAEAPAS